MRIGTWNLQRGGSRAARAAQEEVLRGLDLDAIVLTEPPASYEAGPNLVTSPPPPQLPERRDTWIAITGNAVEPLDGFMIPYERLAAAARVVAGDLSIIVYGTVLPWLSVTSQAPEVAGDDDSFTTFRRVLSEQAKDIRELLEHTEPVLWIGDFNQAVTGPLTGSSKARREALLDVLADLDLVAWNQAAEHAEPSLKTIDLICGPRSMTVLQQGRIDPLRQGVLLSDHAGYWVEI